MLMKYQKVKQLFLSFSQVYEGGGREVIGNSLEAHWGLAEGCWPRSQTLLGLDISSGPLEVDVGMAGPTTGAT